MSYLEQIENRMKPAAPDSKWIQTYSGKAFWPLSPHLAGIDVVDIAHALAMKCRYTGHTRHFYSVAQHSVLASMIVPPADARWGLMHDATEAYLPDVARPVKKSLDGFSDIEERLMACVATKFGLGWPMPASVKEADVTLLATERRDLMSDAPYRWTSTENVSPLISTIDPWGPELAKERFLRRFRELFGEGW